MRNLYFKRSNGEEILVTENISEDYVYSQIIAFCKKINPKFKIYYIRYWDSSELNRIYDFGSHSEFFYWREKD